MLTLLIASAASNWGGGDVPASFDCAMRKLAYAYGKQLLPQRGAFPELFDALGYGNQPRLGARSEPIVFLDADAPQHGHMIMNEARRLLACILRA